MSINKFIGVGRLTRDPELRYSKGGVAVCNFTLALNRHFKSNDGQDADFISCVTFRNTAENLANYMKKGSQIGVDGRLQSRTYDDKDGKTVYVTEVVADSVQFLESRSKGEGAAPSVGQASQDLYGGNQQMGEPIDISDSDLPF